MTLAGINGSCVTVASGAGVGGSVGAPTPLETVNGPVGSEGSPDPGVRNGANNDRVGAFRIERSELD